MKIMCEKCRVIEDMRVHTLKNQQGQIFTGMVAVTPQGSYLCKNCAADNFVPLAVFMTTNMTTKVLREMGEMLVRAEDLLRRYQRPQGDPALVVDTTAWLADFERQRND